MQEPSAIEPVRVSVSVGRPIEESFKLFTEGIDSWWPLATHSVGDERAETAVFEPHEGGRIYERMTGGEEAEWGRVLAWEPPGRVVFSWRPNPERPAPTEVEVRFTEDGDGTRVELEHRGWERLGDLADRARAQYAAPNGWPTVIGEFERAAS